MTDGSATLPTLPSPRIWPLLAAGLLGGAVCAVGGFTNASGFWPAYLSTYLLWLGVSLGALGWLLLHHVTGGRWGWTINREVTAAAQTLPLTALMFLPLLAGLNALYPWAGSTPGESLLNHHQESYLNRTNWLMRAAGYYAVWLISMALLSGARARRLRAPEKASLPRPAAFGLVLFWVTISFAGFDWLMSLEPSWSSTMYGSLLTIGFAVAGLSGAILLRCAADRRAPVSERVRDQEWRDLGNLLQATNLLWVYFAFSQYLIIWSGDLPSEVVWYQRRNSGLAAAASVMLGLFHFAVPFALLLTSDVKRRRNRLAGVAGLLLVMRLVDLDWLVWPAFSGNVAMLALWQIALFVTLGGLWLAAYGWRWSRLAPVPAARTLQELVHADAESGEAMA